MGRIAMRQALGSPIQPAAADISQGLFFQPGDPNQLAQQGQTAFGQVAGWEPFTIFQALDVAHHFHRQPIEVEAAKMRAVNAVIASTTGWTT